MNGRWVNREHDMLDKNIWSIYEYINHIIAWWLFKMNGRLVNRDRQYRLPWATFSLSQGRRRFSHKIEGRGKMKRKESEKGKTREFKGNPEYLRDQAAKPNATKFVRWFVSLSYDLLDQKG